MELLQSGVGILAWLAGLFILMGSIDLLRTQHHTVEERRWPGYLRRPDAFTEVGRHHRARAIRRMVTGWGILVLLVTMELALWAADTAPPARRSLTSFLPGFGSVLIGSSIFLIVLFAGARLASDTLQSVPQLLRVSSYREDGRWVPRLAKLGAALGTGILILYVALVLV